MLQDLAFPYHARMISMTGFSFSSRMFLVSSRWALDAQQSSGFIAYNGYLSFRTFFSLGTLVEKDC